MSPIAFPWIPPPGSRIYRLETTVIVSHAFGPTTYTDVDHALRAAKKLPRGTAWKITKRLNKSGSRVEAVEEGITT